MTLSKKDRDQILAIVRQEVGSKTRTVNQFKGAGLDRREDKLTDMIAFTGKDDDEGQPANSPNPVAT